MSETAFLFGRTVIVNVFNCGWFCRLGEFSVFYALDMLEKACWVAEMRFLELLAAINVLTLSAMVAA